MAAHTNIPRPATPANTPQQTQDIHATPIRHRGASSAAISNSSWTAVAPIEYVPMFGFYTYVKSPPAATVIS